MTRDQAIRIFDKFYRGDASNTAVSGTGLGMRIVKSIVDAHGGQVTVDGPPNERTTSEGAGT